MCKQITGRHSKHVAYRNAAFNNEQIDQHLFDRSRCRKTMTALIKDNDEACPHHQYSAP